MLTQDMVTLSDYAGIQGFGVDSAENMNDLRKALEAGYQIVNQTGGSALRVESLESSLKVLTHSEKHIKLWKILGKTAAYSTVEEYNQVTDWGSQQGFFTREGELPQPNDTAYVRRTALVKYCGTTREVTHPATLVHPAHGDLLSLENKAGILWMLRMIEINLFEGDSSLAYSPPGNPGEAEQWDGLNSLIDPTSFLDLEGMPLQEADIEEASNLVVEAYGYPGDCFLGTRAMSDLSKTFYGRERITLPANAETKIGTAVRSQLTQAGEINFSPDIFIRRPQIAPGAAVGNGALVPTAPASLGVALDAAATFGEFDKSQGTSDAKYAYTLTAANRYGESAAITPVLSATMSAANAAGGAVFNLTITNAAALTVPPEYFIVYRTIALDSATAAAPADLSNYSRILKIPAQSNAAGGVTPAAGTISDRNRIMPFTEVAYVGELSEEVITFRQLAPLMKLNLAVLAPAYRWMLLIYGVMILFAPRKWMRIINVGRIGDSLGPAQYNP